MVQRIAKDGEIHPFPIVKYQGVIFCLIFVALFFVYRFCRTAGRNILRVHSFYLCNKSLRFFHAENGRLIPYFHQECALESQIPSSFTEKGLRSGDWAGEFFLLT